MRVNDLARHARISPHVVRFYARAGLLKPVKNPRNGYKIFGQNELKRVRFIRLAKRLGYSLAEIGELLGRLERGGNPSDLMENILRQRLREHQRKIEALQRMQLAMRKALECLERRIWDTENMEVLCDHFQDLEHSQ